MTLQDLCSLRSHVLLPLLIGLLLAALPESAWAVQGRAQDAYAVLSTSESVWRSRMVAEDTVPLPEGWQNLEFDDREWSRLRLPVPIGVDTWGYGGRLDHVALRATFEVEDVAQAGVLRLNLSYRGGVVVYLNGQEIGRFHVAEDQPMTAEPYGKEAWFVEGDDDQPIRSQNADNHAQWLREHRLRHVRDLRLPSRLLRPGGNVLAVLTMAAPDPMDHTGRFRDHDWPRIHRGGRFLGMGVVEATLHAAGQGVRAPVHEHPPGTRIWVGSPVTDITPDSFPAPDDETAVLRLVGPRGGLASGPIVVSATQPLPAPEVSIDGLRGENGVIDQSRIRWLHASRFHVDAIGADDGFESATYSVLDSHPGPDAPHRPVWIEVSIPEDAAPGIYRGTVRVRAADATRDVPVELAVGAYRLPDQRKYVSLVGMLHQPENVAYRYGETLWSDGHFARLAQVFDLLAGVGNRVLWVPVARPGILGTRETIVHWTGRDGALQPDFRALERYLKLYDERVGPPQFLGLHLWDTSQRNRDIEVTRVHPDGRRESMVAPRFDDPDGVEFWKPVVDGILRITRDLGWPDHAVLISCAHDRKPSDSEVRALGRIAPGLRWNLYSHARGYRAPRDRSDWTHQGMPVGFHEEPWSPHGARGGWDRPFPQASAARTHFHTLGDGGRHAAAYRQLITGNVSTGSGGLGNRTFWGVSRFWFDSWPVQIPGADGQQFHRLRGGGYVNLLRNHETLTAPGRDGPQPTVAYQQIREGLQETEARLVIEIALAHNDLRQRLGAELVERGESVLRDHIRMFVAGKAVWGEAGALPWREHALDLFDTAGAYQEALGVPSLRDRTPQMRQKGGR
ncbi:MAG: hypothetical protein JJU36_02560 [Phycisphaeraceae bacterium]|nr:hypothetical protein [Phycisphaeraceae bacterium]